MTLARGVVAVWSARPSSRPALVLTPSEDARRARYREAADRDRSGVGAALLRLAVRAATGLEDADVTRRCPGCDARDHGPTTVAGTPGHDLDPAAWSVSLTHSGDLVTVAVGHGVGAVGVDVEQARAAVSAVAPVLCRDDELAADLADPDPRGALTTRWVRKEAVLKAARLGLTVPLRHLATSPAHEPARLRSWAAGTRPERLDVTRVACQDLPAVDLAGAGGAHRGAVAALDAGRGPLDVRHRWVGPRELERAGAALSPAGR